MSRASLAKRSSCLNFAVSSLKKGVDHSGASMTPSSVTNSETMIFPKRGPPAVSCFKEEHISRKRGCIVQKRKLLRPAVMKQLSGGLSDEARERSGEMWLIV